MMPAPPVSFHPASGLSTAVVSVLVVDDDDSVRQVLVRWLESSGYSVVSAGGADDALVLLETSPAAVVLCDIRMPGHDGLWLAGQVRQRFPQTAVIISSGVLDDDASRQSHRQGVVDYLVKPFGRDRLREAVNRGIDWHNAAWDARRWRETLQREMENLEAALRDRVRRKRIRSDEDLEALLTSLGGRRSDICEHAKRVAALCQDIAGALAPPHPDRLLLRRAALLHDIGRLAVPDAVLRKPAPLTPEEQALVHAVPQLTVEMLAGIPFLSLAAPVVGSVHERIDGQGYPRRLPGSDLPLEARIIAVADAYDTMTHVRVYRDALAPPDALLELERCAGTQFDPRIVKALQTALARRPSVD